MVIDWVSQHSWSRLSILRSGSSPLHLMALQSTITPKGIRATLANGPDHISNIHSAPYHQAAFFAEGDADARE